MPTATQNKSQKMEITIKKGTKNEKKTAYTRKILWKTFVILEKKRHDINQPDTEHTY